MLTAENQKFRQLLIKVLRSRSKFALETFAQKLGLPANRKRLPNFGAMKAAAVVAMWWAQRIISERRAARQAILKRERAPNFKRGAKFDWAEHLKTIPSSAAFVKYYKVTPDEFDKLATLISPYVSTTSVRHKNVVLSAECRWSMTLRLLAGASISRSNGDSQSWKSNDLQELWKCD